MKNQKKGVRRRDETDRKKYGRRDRVFE